MDLNDLRTLGGPKILEANFLSGPTPNDLLGKVAEALDNCAPPDTQGWKHSNKLLKVPNSAGAFHLTAKSSYAIGRGTGALTLDAMALPIADDGVRLVISLTDSGYWQSEIPQIMAYHTLPEIDSATRVAGYDHAGWGVIEGGWPAKNPLGARFGRAPTRRVIKADLYTNPATARVYFRQFWERDREETFGIVRDLLLSTDLGKYHHCDILDMQHGDTWQLSTFSSTWETMSSVPMLIQVTATDYLGGVLLTVCFAIPDVGWNEDIVAVECHREVLDCRVEAINAELECQLLGPVNDPLMDSDLFLHARAAYQFRRMFWGISGDAMADLLVQPLEENWDLNRLHMDKEASSGSIEIVGHHQEEPGLHLHLVLQECAGGIWIGISFANEGLWTEHSARDALEQFRTGIDAALQSIFPRATLEPSFYLASLTVACEDEGKLRQTIVDGFGEGWSISEEFPGTITVKERWPMGSELHITLTANREGEITVGIYYGDRHYRNEFPGPGIGVMARNILNSLANKTSAIAPEIARVNPKAFFHKQAFAIIDRQASLMKKEDE